MTFEICEICNFQFPLLGSQSQLEQLQPFAVIVFQFPLLGSVMNPPISASPPKTLSIPSIGFLPLRLYAI